MAKLLLERDILENGFTLGKLSIDGEFFCYTVEDKVRHEKIDGATAIPFGTYKITLTLSPRFKKILPLLHNVPNFEGVRIHAGNTAEDTEGCIIVGMGRTDSGVSQSRAAMGKLMPILEKDKTSIIDIV